MVLFLIIFQVGVTLFSLVLMGIAIFKTLPPSDITLLSLIVLTAQIILGIILLKIHSVSSNIKAKISKNPELNIEIFPEQKNKEKNN